MGAVSLKKKKKNIGAQPCAYHVGQIVFLARHFAGGAWKSLSIPKGQSKTLDVNKRGGAYRIRREESGVRRQT